MLDLFRSGIVAPPPPQSVATTAYVMDHALATVCVLLYGCHPYA